MPELAPDWTQPGRQAALARASADTTSDLAVRWAVLHAGLTPSQALASGARLRAPQACADLARLLCSESGLLASVWRSDREALALLERCDALRKPDRFRLLLRAAQQLDPTLAPSLQRWQQASHAASGVAAGVIVQGVPEHPTPSRALRIREALAQARCAAIAQA
jgi:tRNA nucleotidyltransferase (CCA-adding enzyme)